MNIEEIDYMLEILTALKTGKHVEWRWKHSINDMWKKIPDNHIIDFKSFRYKVSDIKQYILL